MNLVFDSSVVIKWFMDEPLMEQARDILYAYQNNLVNLFAPDLLIAEVGNILWKKTSLSWFGSCRNHTNFRTIAAI